MLVSIDKRGSVGLPASLRRELGLVPGTHLELTVAEGGNLVLNPVMVYPTVRLSEKGLTKLAEARESGEGEMPAWLSAEIADAEADAE